MELDKKHKDTNEDNNNVGQHHIHFPNPEIKIIFVNEYKKHDSEGQENFNSKEKNCSGVCEPIPGCSHW